MSVSRNAVNIIHTAGLLSAVNQHPDSAIACRQDTDIPWADGYMLFRTDPMHRPLHTSHHPQIERTLISVACERRADSTHRDQDEEAGDARTVETVPVPAPRVRFFVVPVARPGQGAGQAHPDREGGCDVISSIL